MEFRIKGSDRFDGNAVDGDGTMKAGKEITPSNLLTHAWGIYTYKVARDRRA